MRGGAWVHEGAYSVPLGIRFRSFSGTVRLDPPSTYVTDHNSVSDHLRRYLDPWVY